MINSSNIPEYKPSAGSIAGRNRSPKNLKKAAEESAKNVKDTDNEQPVSDSVLLKSIKSGARTPFGKIPIIITSGNRDKAKTLKDGIIGKYDKAEANLKEELPLVDGVKVDVDPFNMDELLGSLPEGSNVVPDNKIKFPTPDQLTNKEVPKDGKDRPALDVVNSTLGINRLWEQGYTGKGIGIAIIDSGIYPHPDIKDRIAAFVDMSDGKKKPYDPYGHGTHVAGVAAGSGVASAGKFKGVAPDADVVGIRITSVGEAIKGIQWAIENKEKYNIKVLNMSLGDFPLKSHKDDPWAQAARKAWEAGITVVVAAGNEGPGEGTISTPGIEPKVITVGAIDDNNTATRSDDLMSHFSSRGPTSPDGLTKPDVVAPGVDIFGPLSPDSTLDTPDLPHVGKDYIAISGSSMATPMVSGLAALLHQANPDLKPDDIKKILMETAEKYIPQATPNDQGAGLIDPMESLQVALGLKNKPKDKKAEADAQLAKSENVPMHFAEESHGKKTV